MVKDVPVSVYWAISQHNFANGQNKLSRDELVQILRRVRMLDRDQGLTDDQTVPGGFDFVYLRFDFVNGCNVSVYMRLYSLQVGYAFVNFITTAALCHFVDQKVGKKWHLFSSEKVLQVGFPFIMLTMSDKHRCHTRTFSERFVSISYLCR